MSAAALEAPVLYGVFDISAQSQDPTSHHDGLRVKSNGSRAGMKFENKINDKLDWLFQIESSIDFDSSVAGETKFGERNIYLGLAGRLGRVIIGKHDTPLKRSQGDIDLFTDTDIQIYAVHNGDNRVEDTVIFDSINYNGVSLHYGLVKNPENVSDDFGHSVAVHYDNQDAYFALAIDQNVAEKNITRLVASRRVGQFHFGTMLQRSEDILEKRITFGGLFSINYSRYDWSLKAQYSISDDKLDQGQLITLGVDWRYTKKFKLYGLCSQRKSHLTANDNLVSLGVRFSF